MSSPSIADRLQEVWEDQRAFNLLLRQPPTSETEMSEQVRDFVLYTEAELHELLRTLPWKKHRRVPARFNEAHMHEEGIDVFKFVISILQIIGLDTLDDVIEAYWRKTAVVRQRYQEEWVHKIDRPCVVIDIDNVLCDYITGFLDWLQQTQKPVPVDFNHLRRTRPFLNARVMGVTDEEWRQWQHEFRVSGYKRTLPVFNDAYTFLYRMRVDGYQIVLLTARPIDKYPNIFTDTIFWLNENKLPYDFVWWATDKAERLSQVAGFREHVRFAVDDDIRYVEQFAAAGIKTYWLQRDTMMMGSAHQALLGRPVHVVNSLLTIDNY
jgi:hypothetical protein